MPEDSSELDELKARVVHIEGLATGCYHRIMQVKRLLSAFIVLLVVLLGLMFIGFLVSQLPQVAPVVASQPVPPPVKKPTAKSSGVRRSTPSHSLSDSP